MSAAIRATTLVAVDPATAFAVFTREIDAWWRRGPRFRWLTAGEGRLRFEPGVGGRLVEQHGDDEFEVGRVRVWEPAKRLVFEFRARSFEPGQVTEVDVAFAAEGEETRVTVEHRGWEELAADHPARHGLDAGALRSLMGVWWADLLVSARRYAEHTTSRGG
ncbi:MAG: SRPBCC domain-containing protein [Myxococcota bacterium]